MKPMAASIAPTTASKTIIRIGDLGGAGGMSDIGAGTLNRLNESQILVSISDAVTAANARNAVGDLNSDDMKRYAPHSPS